MERDRSCSADKVLGFFDGDSKKAAPLVQSMRSIIVRSLEGHIEYWNRAAEKKYGWSRKEAVGSVSHHLLNTVFPEPLEEINRQLVTQGFWEGYLLHTLSDGSRVRVLSRWELERAAQIQPRVIETNDRFITVTPNSAHLRVDGSLCYRLARLLWKEKWWWIVPLVLTLALLQLILELTEDIAVMGLFQ